MLTRWTLTYDEARAPFEYVVVFVAMTLAAKQITCKLYIYVYMNTAYAG